jgi:hypothetical protein
VSDSILYLGIVAIWAGFLVPALVRRPHSARTEVDSEAVNLDAESLAEAQRPQTESVEFEVDVHIEADGQGPEYQYDVHMRGYGAAAASSFDESSVVPSARRPSQSRQRMLRARRRMLSILIALVFITAGFVAAGYVRWWICVPPIALLTLYVLLLREIALADDELARKRAAREAQAARDVWRRAHQAWEESRESRTGPTAQVIDISGRRMRDQLYDQYADAAVRAVGD